jgi:hypothetical protein
MLDRATGMHALAHIASIEQDGGGLPSGEAGLNRYYG